MSKFDQVVDACKAQMEKYDIECDEALLTAIARSLGPSIYNRDSSLVAAGNKAEIEGVKKNFVAKKLGVEGEEADSAIAAAIEKIGQSNRQKLRPVFYYLIVKHLGKESVYA
ncbi:MAG: hypothetical protein CSA52_02900 [Gammaproteobacteria bacterium]|nr:MAG: hypothetical protein CSB48_04570 [Pseudomonadota bacterium]PIE38347.1 MAG: hypothetical protein CSA52_02900 [Gammaproteobacteria bacterium]